MTENRIKVEHKNFPYLVGFKHDRRATVGALKKVLDEFDDDLPTMVVYDCECGETSVDEIYLDENGIVRLVA